MKPVEDQWTVFGFPHCGYYKAAIDLLKKKKKKYLAIEITREHFNCFKTIGSHRTSPIIFDPELNFIGGYSDLVEYLNKN